MALISTAKIPPARFSAAAWVFGLLASTIFVCSSVFFFNGSKVDESEVVLNALAIAAGGWAPEWSPGYGHLAMYIPGIALALSSIFLQAMGAAASHADAVYLLFESGGAYRITRFVYALADVATALVFARIITRVTGMRLVAAMSVLYYLLAPDTWQYANYVRTDTLVSLFTAIAFYLLVAPRTKYTPYLLGIALGAAIACKYSAAAYLGLVALLLLPEGDGAANFRQRMCAALVAGVTSIVAMIVFQPHYDYSSIFSAVNVHLSGSKFTQEAVGPAERLSRLWAIAKTLEPLALVFAATMWLGLLRPRRFAPLLMGVAIGVAPFFFSNFPRDYWLIPFADVLRGAGWFGLACAIAALGSRSAVASSVLKALVAVGLLSVVVTRLPDLQKNRMAPTKATNAEDARRWLYVNVANRERLVYAYEKNFLLPRAYSFHDYKAAADFSRVFIFYREGFESLHKAFGRQLYTVEYADFAGMGQVPPMWLRVDSDGSGPAPRLCAGERCYPAKVVACEALPNDARPCRKYMWNMGRPEFRIDLSRMSLELPSSVKAFGVCWYNCRPGSLSVSVPTRQRGQVPFLDLAASLFAPAEVKSLTAIRAMPADNRRLFIVTTPQAYQPWLGGAGLSPAETRKPGAFERMFKARLVQRFHEGHGPVIEIYEKMPESSKASRTPSHAHAAK